MPSNHSYRSFRSQTLHYFGRPHDAIPDVPLHGAAAWSAGPMRADPGRWQHHLSPGEIDELDQALGESRRFEGRLQHMRRRDFPLPLLGPRIATWRSAVKAGRGFVLVRGLPVHRWSETQLERAYWGLGLHLGRPGAQNDFGELLGHVRDERLGPAADVRQYRTAQEIPFHCDAADGVALLCVRQAKQGGASRIASSVSIFNLLLAESPLLARRLFEPLPLDTHAEQGLAFMPIVPAAHYRGELRTFMHPGYFRSGARRPGAPRLDELAARLLDRYEALAASEELCLDMTFEPGDLQLLSNHTIVHARAGYRDHEDSSQRRHLLRLWLSFDEALPASERWARVKAKLGLARERLSRSRKGG